MDSKNEKNQNHSTIQTGTVKNQCDGCVAGANRYSTRYWPWLKERWYHRFPDGSIMSCEKDKYQ